jgi:hypothetical protein
LSHYVVIRKAYRITLLHTEHTKAVFYYHHTPLRLTPNTNTIIPSYYYMAMSTIDPF